MVQQINIIVEKHRDKIEGQKVSVLWVTLIDMVTLRAVLPKHPPNITKDDKTL